MFFQSVKNRLFRPIRGGEPIQFSSIAKRWGAFILLVLVSAVVADLWLWVSLDLEEHLKNPDAPLPLGPLGTDYFVDECGIRPRKNIPARTVCGYTFTELDGVPRQQSPCDLAGTNFLGLRDHDPPRDSGKRIALIVGDSMTYGVGVSNLNQTWPRHLTEEFAKFGPDWAKYWFMNAGVCGYNLWTEVCLLEKIIIEMQEQGFKTDLVIVAFYTDTWPRNRWGVKGLVTLHQGTRMASGTLEKLEDLPVYALGTHLYDAPHRFLLRWSRIYLLTMIRTEQHLYPSGYRLKEMEGDERTWEYNRGAFIYLQEVTTRYNLPTIVVYLPNSKLVGHEDVASVDRQGLRAVIQEFNLPFVDTLPSLAARAKTYESMGLLQREMIEGSFDEHYGPRGNQIFAEELAPLIMGAIARLPPR